VFFIVVNIFLVGICSADDELRDEGG